ncbi:helix-turn-helix domain-containing protein [Actinoplanes sp. NPDC051343]|uniref:helix-turn-helix domain-containing protein n=1 Tax=Actinoplanes sp. NPDC051343 TaxID=3363906 RepID=UPI00378CB8E5
MVRAVSTQKERTRQTDLAAVRAGTLVKARRKSFEARHSVIRDIVTRYESGESIRSIAATTGRSWGFIHRVLTESGVHLRQRGGARRRKKA